MDTLLVEFALGLYFTISAISFSGGRFSADGFKLIAGIVLLVLAYTGVALI